MFIQKKILQQVRFLHTFASKFKRIIAYDRIYCIQTHFDLDPLEKLMKITVPEIVKSDSDWKRVLEDCPDSSCAVVFDEDDYLSYLKVRFVPDTERDLFTRRYVSQASNYVIYLSMCHV